MIHVSFVEPDSDDWKQWKAETERARKALIAEASAGKKPTIDEKLYKRMRSVIFKAFNRKCAYCETKIIGEDEIGIDQPGDIDHFRPKGRVLGDDGKSVQIKLQDGLRNHPGYYWLAYDWRNLLPSCITCNRPTRTPEGKLIGKWDRFPVQTTRAFEPDKEGEEQPIFLHPLFDNPEDEFVFEQRTGLLCGKTERAQACIEQLGLNREGLRSNRRKAYLSVLTMARIAIPNSLAESEEVRKSVADDLKILNEYRRGEQPYSLAGRKALTFLTEQLEALRDQFLRRTSRTTPLKPDSGDN